MATTAKPKAPARTPETKDVRAVLDLIKQRNVQVVDVKFCDLPGTWQHFSIPAATLNEEMVKEGLGFDGSSIRGFSCHGGIAGRRSGLRALRPRQRGGAPPPRQRQHQCEPTKSRHGTSSR